MDKIQQCLTVNEKLKEEAKLISQGDISIRYVASMCAGIGYAEIQIASTDMNRYFDLLPQAPSVVRSLLEIIKDLEKDREETLQVLHDLREDHPAYAVTIGDGGIVEGVFSTSSLSEAMSWAESGLKSLVEYGGYDEGEAVGEIYDGHLLVHQCKMSKGCLAWSKVKEFGF